MTIKISKLRFFKEGALVIDIPKEKIERYQVKNGNEEVKLLSLVEEIKREEKERGQFEKTLNDGKLVRKEGGKTIEVKLFDRLIADYEIVKG